MFGIYYKDPRSGEMFPCVSSKRMEFTSNQELLPALFAQAKNAEKALRDYRRYVLESGVWRGKATLDQHDILVAGNLDNYLVVPMKVYPQYEYGYQLPAKKK